MAAATAGASRSARARLASTLAAAALVLGGLLGLPSSAVAAEDCVGVIVDARLLGGDVRTGCAEGDPDSGLDALTRAGFRYAFVPRQPGLVCQVDGLPECARTSTTTYWSYWYRAPGSDRWVYARQGAGAHDPEPGGTEAWVWQEGGRREPPDIGLRAICPQLAAPAPEKSRTSSPKPAGTKTKQPAPPPAGTARPTRATADADASGRPTGKPVPSKTAATTPPPSPSATPSSSETSVAATSSAAGPTTSPVARRSDDASSGVPGWVGLAVGGLLVAALGTAAVVRGRRTSDSP